MPYSNVPRHLWGKMDKCVEDVMARQGVDKKRAVAICHSSIVKERAEVADHNSDPDVLESLMAPIDDITPAEIAEADVFDFTDEARARILSKASRRVGLDEDEIKATVAHLDTVSGGKASIEKIKEKIAEGKNLTAREQESLKVVLMGARSTPEKQTKDSMSPMSWDEYDEWSTMVENMRQADAAIDAFRDIQWNILYAYDMSLEEKAAKLAALANGLPGRVKAEKAIQPEEPQSIKERIAGIFKKNNDDPLADLQSSSFQVFKDQHGNFRYLGWMTNKFRDIDFYANPKNGGEILTDQAHKEYVEWANADPEHRMPVLLAWHHPKTAAKNRADFLTYLNGFVIMSGQLTEKEAQGILAAGEKYNLGMSHGFYPIARDEEKGYVTSYRSFEGSHLPVEFAANPWTLFSVLRKEVSKMEKMPAEQRDYLTTVAGADFVAMLEKETEQRQAELLAAGVDSKARKTEDEVAPEAKDEAPPAEAKEEDAPAEAEAAKDVSDELVEKVANAVVEKIGIKPLSEFLGKMRTDVDSIQAAQTQTTKEAAADAIIAEISGFEKVWEARPSNDPTNDVDAKSVDQANLGNLAWIDDTFGSSAMPQ